MAVVFQILIALLASTGQSGAVPTTHSSSLSTELHVSAASAYLSPKHNDTSTFGAGEQAHSRVSATRSGVATVAAVNTNRSGGGHSVPTPTDTADHTGKAANVNSESEMLPANVASEREMLLANATSEREMLPANVTSENEMLPAKREMLPANVTSEREMLPANVNSEREMLPANVTSESETVPANVTSERETLPANVTSESVPGQAADSLTARGTTSAVNWIEETVTDVSETVDTVPGSVHTTNNNDDITAEAVITSLTATDIPGTVGPLFPRPHVTPPNDCEAVLCEKEAGYFIINTAACPAKDTPTIHTTKPTTVELISKEIDAGKSDSICHWVVDVRRDHFVNVSINQLALESAGHHGDPTLQLDVQDESEYIQLTFNASVLTERNVTFTSTSSLHFRFRGKLLYLESSITFHFRVQRGAIVRDLPVVRLTDTVGYVTSPRFNGLDRFYFSSYDGAFRLQVSDNESVLISFVHFNLEDESNCSYDYLDFNVTALNDTWRKCGTQNMPSRVYRSSLNLFFHADNSYELTGFKMMYAIFPRSQEPQQLSDNQYNCSVPHFHSFKLLFSCNMVTECRGNEDEKDCGYHSNDCGDGAIDAGTKCYRIIRRGVTATWSDANYECIRDSQNLVTLATPEEFRRFRHIVTAVRNPSYVYIGARLVDRQGEVTAEAMYTHLWQWVDGRTAFFLNITTAKPAPRCAYYSPGKAGLVSQDCRQTYEADVVCEFDKENKRSENNTIFITRSSISIDPEDIVWNVSVVQCISGHVTRDFLSCDTQGQCGAKVALTSCHSGSVTIAMFVCERSRESLHYTLVCDHIQHCEDNTDEEFCHFSLCPISWFRCQNGQCIALGQLCDGTSDCYDGSDEVCVSERPIFEPTTLPPAVLDVDGTGQPFLKQMNDSDECPVTHFQCSQGYCLPIYLRCNGVDDCPNREDEASCESYTCSGFYRCRGSKVCLHADHVCDGVFQCPQYDDELLCEKMACPDVCQCQGLTFVCTANFSATSYPALRYLDANGSSMTPNGLTHNLFLIYLRLSDCRITKQPTFELPNLRQLYLNENELTYIDMHHFNPLKNLRVLVLSGNPLSMITNSLRSEPGTMVLQTIDLSGTSLDVYNGSALAGCPNLRTLNISGSKLTTITDESFQYTPQLENVDVRGSPLKDFPNDLLRGLASLKVVYADNYKLCCKAMLPEDFDLNKCHAKQDLLASCEDLLRSNVYRVFLWLFASLSVVGNVGSFVARLYLGNKGAGLGSFSIFVSNLSMADFFMGVYLAIVGVADQLYSGEYLWYDDQWKESTVCKVAGFLSLMSSEVSAFIICLITLDRFLALRFPFSSLHFSRRSALAACAIVWVVGIALATVPLLPVTSHWEFFSQTGICIPLPFTTSERFHGYHYSFSVMIILNFVLFMLIAVGQAFIYWSVRSNSISSSKKTGSRDATIARRLTTIVLSDFLCWFPIGLLGVLASTGTPIPGELNVAVAIFVMPFNSALNPFLYTFNVLMEKRRKAQEAYLLKRLESSMCTEQTHSEKALKMSRPVNRSSAMELIQTWLSEQVLNKEDFLSCSAASCNGSAKDLSGEH